MKKCKNNNNQQTNRKRGNKPKSKGKLIKILIINNIKHIKTKRIKKRKHPKDNLQKAKNNNQI